MQTTRIVLAARPVGEPKATDFRTETVDLPALADGEVLLRVLDLSLDPYMRGRMSAAESYADPVAVGDVMVGGTVCEVVETRSPRRAVGDLVLSYSGWQTHAVAPAEQTRRLDRASGPDAAAASTDPISTAPISTALGVLGMPGFTAYAGLLQIGRPQPGETVVVAAATGPVGSAVGQIARIHGARAVGIAGGPEKCRALLDEFGFDAAVDHRAPDFADRLAAAVPDGVDVYFENVGGAVTDAVLGHLNLYARVPVCGLVSGYNATGPESEGPARLAPFLRRILTKSLTVRGFIQSEFVADHYERFLADMGAWVREGRVAYREDVTDGLEHAVEAFVAMLAGRNFGKVVVHVQDATGGA